MSPVSYALNIPLFVIKGCTSLGGHKFDKDRKCEFCGTNQWDYEDRIWESTLEKQGKMLLSDLKLAEYRMLQLGLGTFPP